MGTPQYNPNVPEQPTDTLNVSQPDLLANFQSIFNIFNVNHVSLDAGATAGNHTIVQLIEIDDTPQTSPTELSVYVNKVEGQTDQVFLQYGGNGKTVQLTNYQIYSLSNTSNPNSYFTFLPGKMIIYFGSFTTLTKNELNLIPPVATNIISMAFCPIGAQTSSSYKPRVSIVPPVNDLYSKIIVLSSVSASAPSEPPACYYIVLANF